MNVSIIKDTVSFEMIGMKFLFENESLLVYTNIFVFNGKRYTVQLYNTDLVFIFLKLCQLSCMYLKNAIQINHYLYFFTGSFTSTAQKVLTEKVLYGQTISYKNLAALCGNEKACRAVGMAMRNNPISFIVPCHRVITHSGHLGNYSGGHKNKIKQWLLTHENAIP